MATVIFQVSRFIQKSRGGYPQLRLKERFSKETDKVTANATLHLLEDATSWLKGLHFAIVEDDGEVYYSFDNEDKDLRIHRQFNFKSHHLTGLRQQISDLGDILTNPPKDDEGVSELRGYQLHIAIKSGCDVKYTMVEPKSERDRKWGDKLELSVSPADIVSVKLVQHGEEEYVEAPGDYMQHSLMTQSLYTKRSTSQPKPTTVDEAKSVIATLRAKSRGANRTAAKAARQAGKAAAAITPPPQEEPAKVSRVLVDDEDQPE